MGTIIVALIAAISAIVAPIITACINNSHSLKAIQLNNFYKEKFKLYTSFVRVYFYWKEEKTNENYYNFVATSYQVMAVSNYFAIDEITKLLRMSETFISPKLCIEDEHPVTEIALDQQLVECISQLNEDIYQTIKITKSK